MPDIFSLTEEDWVLLLRDINKDAPVFYSRSIFSWIHRKNIWDISLFSDLPKALRSDLKKRVKTNIPLILNNTFTSADGATKFLYATFDGFPVESVYIPYKQRVSLCISALSSFMCLGKPIFKEHYPVQNRFNLLQIRDRIPS